MKLTILMENTSFGTPHLLAEAGLSVYIEDENTNILFDTGRTEALIYNANILGIDLSHLDNIVFSHGDDDHTGGFPDIVKGFDVSQTKIYAHPDCFHPKIEGAFESGSVFDTHEMQTHFNLNLTKDPIQVTKNIMFLGEIPCSFDFEKRKTHQKIRVDGKLKDDYILDDSALVYEGAKGLVIITGCSHSGICNIIEYAKKVTGNTRVHGIVGGFHLFKIDERLEKIIEYLVQVSLEVLAPCHCLSFEVKAAIHKRLPIKNMVVGSTLEFE